MKFYLAKNGFNYDWHSIINSYLKYVKNDFKVLEIGASIPARTRELSRHCEELIGVELYPERTPKDFANVKYKIADWQALSKVIPEESIDLAISSHVIEHVPDDLKAINELYKILRPGGIAIINTPNRKRLTRVVIEVFMGHRKFPYWEHQREYTENDLLNLLNKSLFDKYIVTPLVFGIHGGPIHCYVVNPPVFMRKYANYWEVHLFK